MHLRQLRPSRFSRRTRTQSRPIPHCLEPVTQRRVLTVTHVVHAVVRRAVIRVHVIFHVAVHFLLEIFARVVPFTECSKRDVCVKQWHCGIVKPPWQPRGVRANGRARRLYLYLHRLCANVRPRLRGGLIIVGLALSGCRNCAFTTPGCTHPRHKMQGLQRNVNHRHPSTTLKPWQMLGKGRTEHKEMQG